jgi:hypothetical protein
MGTVISNLKARFGVDTTDFKQGLKDGEKAMSEFKGAAGDQIAEFASMFGVNMSGVSNSIGMASRSLGFLKQSFIAAAEGGEVLTLASKILKWALVSTGLGALVVALGSVAAYFMKSAEGGGKFAKILAQVKAVFNDVIERFVVFGKGLVDFSSGKFKQGWEEMRDAFKGMGDEIKEDVKAAGELAEKEEALKKTEIGLIVSASERKAKIMELRQQAKEEQEDSKKKLALLQDAYKLTQQVYGDEIGLETKRLKLMKDKLALQTTDPTLEQQKEIAEQQAKVNELIREQAKDLKAIDRELNTVTKTVEKEEAQFRSFSNIKMPKLMDAKDLKNIKTALEDLHHTYIKLGESISATYELLDKVSVDVTESLNNAFKNGAEGFGEFLGTLMTGTGGIKDFGKLIATTFADMAINVGKIAIGAGLAVLGIKNALMTLNPYVAITAGVALIAIGTAVKGALSNIATGGSGSSSIASQGTYDTRTGSAVQTQKIIITGKLTAEGRDLVYIFNQEINRKSVST